MITQSYKTPEPFRARGNASWVADIDAYISSHGSSPGGGRDMRHDLVACVKTDPQAAEAWASWLAYEEASGSNATQGLQAAADPGRVSLYHMYYWATTLVPRSSYKSHKEAYLKLWLGFARQQWARSPEDARDTFKTLKNQHIGDASAQLYYEWASLEHAAGNISKALGVLAKGIRADAQPSSLLEQLRAEMQSGTFDLKHLGGYTDTLTLDAIGVAPRQTQQIESTPAPAGKAEQRSMSVGALTAVGTRPASAVLAGVASCLKGSGTTGAAMLNSSIAAEHATRAVTFAADVHDAETDDCGRRPASHSAGSASAYSSRSARTSEGHTGCMSSSSTSSRSTASVHEASFLPFSTAAATSYKSSTTESSGMEGMEEDTISCKAAAGVTGGFLSRDASTVKPSAATIQGSSTATPGPSLGGNTATLGLKRFGFKSRALRVGGTAELPAISKVAQAASEESSASASRAAVIQASSSLMPPPANMQSSGTSTASRGPSAVSAAAALEEEDDASAAGRKRRAGEGSTPSPKTSPKLAATYKDGQQCKVQPEDKAATAASAAGAAATSSRSTAVVVGAAADVGQCDTAVHAGCQGVVPGNSIDPAAIDGSSSDDSVPLVSSKLAARLAQDKGTPLHSKSKDDAGWPGVGKHTPPAEGQLPSSLDNTPEMYPLCTASTAKAATRDVDDGSRTALDLSRHHRRQTGRTGSSTNAGATAPGSNPAAAVPVQQFEEEQQPLPTMVLADVPPCEPAASRNGQGADAVSSHAHHNLQQQQQVEPPMQRSRTASVAVQPSAVGREPLRPLQTQSQAAGAQTTAPQAKMSAKQLVRTAPVAMPAGDLQEQQPAQSQQRQQQQPKHQHNIDTLQQQSRQQQQQRPIQTRPREDAQTVFVQGVRYTKLECVGRGGSSKVFKVMGPNCKIYALKRIRLAGRDAEAASGFIDEINLLLRLRNKPNIIQLVDSQVFQEEGLIYMVQEYGEIDLARLLAKHDAARRAAAGADLAQGGLLKDNLDENFIRLYWQQMLQAVSGVHDQRIVHSDLKPANFLLVEGQLKLIDFGIAKAISGDTTSIARESQVGTLNYMSPEAILGGSNNILGGPAARVGRPSDVWSLGCILYQMVYGRTPFAELPFLPKMHAICNPQHQVAYPPLENKDLMDVMKRCLERDAKARITLQELLEHPFLHPNRRKAAPGPAPTGVGLSEEQMKLLVAQVAAAGAAGMTDIDKLTKDLMAKLQSATITGATSATAQGSNSHRGRAAEHEHQQEGPVDIGRSRSRIPNAPSGHAPLANSRHQQHRDDSTAPATASGRQQDSRSTAAHTEDARPSSALTGSSAWR